MATLWEQEGNSVRCKHARFTFISPRSLRLEYSPEGIFEDRPTIKAIRKEYPEVALKVVFDEAQDTLRIASEALVLEYSPEGEGFTPANLKVKAEALGVNWCFGDEDTGNLGGSARSLDNCEGEAKATWDNKADGSVAIRPLGDNVETDSGVVSTGGWSFVDDSDGIIVEENERGLKPVQRPEGVIDQYLFVYGKDLKGAVREAAEVFGTQPILPRYAYGYWYSRFWTYTDEEIYALLDRFEQHDLPLDVIVVDMDWHKLGWTGYSWDTDLFPDPDHFLRELKRRHLQITLNLHPADGVAKHEDMFEAFCKRMGKDASEVDKIEFTPSSQEFMQAYFELLHHPQEDKGVDIWWMDWQQGTECEFPGLDPMAWLTHTHWHDQVSRRPKRRPLNFSRYSGIGSGRMPLAFTGDVFTTWESMRGQIHYIARSANVLFGYWSMDLGGHLGVDYSPELYVRWVQFGIYSPITRTHASKDPKSDRRFWQYPEEYAESLSEALRRRYELIPYIYTEARKMEESGLSFMRALYFEWPEEAEAYEAKDQYYFGDSMMVAPVVKPRSEQDLHSDCDFWLPPGDWIDTARGVKLAGGRHASAGYVLEEVPVFVRPGAVIPEQRNVRRLHDGSAPNLCLRAYAGGAGDYTLYEDDGIHTDYREGAYATLHLEHESTQRSATLKLNPFSGDFDGLKKTREVTVRLAHRMPPARVLFNGEPIEYAEAHAPVCWGYDARELTVRVELGDVDLTGENTLVVEWDEDSELLEGQAAIVSRLQEISAISRALSLWKPVHPEERVPARVAQIVSRLNLNPHEAKGELRELKEGVSQSLKALETTREIYAEKNDSDYFRSLVTRMKPAINMCKRILRDF